MSAKAKKSAEPTNPENARGIRVFVYGTLKRLHYNHPVISGPTTKDTEFLGFCYVKGPFQMRDLTFYPGVQYVLDNTKINRIYGEVYRVTEDTLKALDILEGNGHFFTRVQVETPWKKAWMYMIPANFDSEKPIIEAGVWRPNVQEKVFIHSGKPFMTADEYFQQDMAI
jgi:gamma-glutamylcyclotransferase (GGCT)/AIG2-like uncharacterized protein YtfP